MVYTNGEREGYGVVQIDHHNFSIGLSTLVLCCLSWLLKMSGQCERRRPDAERLVGRILG